VLVGEALVRIEPGEQTSAGPAGCGHFRASHADREQVIDTLKVAFVQGRLTKDELELRVGQTLASRTHAELAALTGDIPAGVAAAQPPPAPAPARGQAARAAACVSLVLVLLASALVIGHGNDFERLIGVAVLFLPACGVSLGGLLMFHSWLEKRARRQLPQEPAASVTS
jgi:hypothetical protein